MEKRKVNWNDLRYFLEVARKGRLLTAAKRLNVNHTTVSRRISVLEEALEAKLFGQDETGFHLTELGEALLPLAQQVEDITDLALERVQHSGQSLSGSLRVGAPDGFGNTFLASRMSKFMRENPDFKIELVPVPLTHDLQKREVDIVIRVESTDRKNIYCKKICDYKLFLYTSHEFVKTSKVDITDLNEIIECPFAGYVEDILYSEQLSFNHFIDSRIQSQFNSSTVLAQYEFIANGGGFGVLPYFMVYDDPRLIPVFTDTFSFTRSYWLLIPEELRRMASVRRLETTILSLTDDFQSRFLPENI